MGYRATIRSPEIGVVPSGHALDTWSGDPPAPLAGLWRMFVLRPMHLYAMVTCWKVSDWGTRGDGVEVPAAEPADTVQLPQAAPADDETLRIPVLKLLDPDTETTLKTPIPRQRTTTEAVAEA